MLYAYLCRDIHTALASPFTSLLCMYTHTHRQESSLYISLKGQLCHLSLLECHPPLNINHKITITWRTIDSLVFVASEVYMHFKKYPSCYFLKTWSTARIKMIADTRQFCSLVYVLLCLLRSYNIQNNNNNNNVLLGGFLMSQLCI